VSDDPTSDAAAAAAEVSRAGAPRRRNIAVAPARTFPSAAPAVAGSAAAAE
jgi:hypothetical protein